jgi:hypothetical protein
MSKLFSENFLVAIKEKLNQHPEFQKEAKAASFTIGFQDSKANTNSWIKISDGQLEDVGVTEDKIANFTFVGETAAWNSIVDSEPLNRLVRRNQLRITGDQRLCMKNWKMVWLFGQMIKEV